MEWKKLLNLETYSIRNPLARIFYSSATIGTAAFLSSQISQVSSGDTTSLVLALSTTSVLTEAFKSLGGETLGEAVSDRFFKNYRRKDILENGDLQKAVGDAICATVRQVYEAKNQNANQKILKKLSNVPVSVWLELVVELEKEKDTHLNISLEEIDRLMPRNLNDVFAVKASEFNNVTLIDRNTWGKILRKFCLLRGISTSNQDNENFTDTIELAALELEQNFPESLKHTIISSVTNNHKAYANLQLKINGEILYFVRQNEKKTDEILEIVKQLEQRNVVFESLFSCEKFTPPSHFFVEAYNLEKETLELVLVAIDKIEEVNVNVIDLKKMLSERLTPNQIQTGSFLPVLEIKNEIVREINDFFREVKKSINLILSSPSTYRKHKSFDLEGFNYQLQISKEKIS